MPARTIGWSRGYLPHIEGPLTQHVVIRTADALPRAVVERAYEDAEARFLALERELDAGRGACPLVGESADCVAEALRSGAGYALKAWCVMPNHVHALIALDETAWLGDIVRCWKGPTARA